MDAVVLIPARYASTRLPGKMLLSRTGKPLIRHTIESVRPARRVERVVVATDDERIAEAARAAGAEAVQTRADHASGSDRLAEAVERLGLEEDRIIVNVQGDEPELPPGLVDRLVERLEGSDAPMATLCAPLSEEEASDANRVKVVLDGAGQALYFSRAAIPHDRDGEGAVRRFLHLGVYAYRAGFLRTFAGLPPTPLERAEKLEQLRALEHGYRIAVAVVEYDGVGVDTSEDYDRFVERVRSRLAAGAGGP